MPSLTVRNVSAEVHRALRVRAALHGRSIEAELRDMLEAAVRPQGRVKLGSLLTEIGRQAQLSDAEFALFERTPGTSPARAAGFE
ncbi:FitA-like ribbon-helix-helix domain-containing protein [Serpentinimonas barnesii]|uniref:FitA-like ribbon-helix-helix domain-containing protein n=1 Tax=Serpentinimonas barnesii TaxID=1458427 RepID=UPI000496D4F9|nr:plasmid stabilization protein [Serpentinimonas barnesii]